MHCWGGYVFTTSAEVSLEIYMEMMTHLCPLTWKFTHRNLSSECIYGGCALKHHF